MAPGGGFQLADGPFPLSKLSGVAIGATAVSLAGGEDPDVIAARVAAFRAAGARDVLVEAWTPEPGLRDRLVTHFWEGINRRYSATRALSEARALTVREIGDEARLPASWAGYLVSGRP